MAGERFAVCIFGLPRGNGRTWQSLLSRLIDQDRTDLYIHSWHVSSKIDNWHKSAEPSRSRLGRFLSFMVKNCSSIKSIRVDSQRQLDHDILTVDGSKIYISNQYHMWRSVELATELVASSGHVYSNVIYARSDLLYRSGYDYSFLENAKNSMLHSGVLSGTDVYSCEDLVYALPYSSLGILKQIRARTLSAFYTRNNIPNPLIYECLENRLQCKPHFTYQKDFHIVRPPSLRRFASGLSRAILR